MKIIRVLNTNAILTRDSNNEEIVLLGAGIGFKQKPGDNVDVEKVEKRFVLNQKEHQTRFQELANSIPAEYIMVSEQIISYGKTMYEMELSETIHISLADHIHTAVINMQNGIQIPNTLLLDIQRFYRNEYLTAKQGLLLIQENLKCTLPEDEAGFIAMHFVNAQCRNGSLNINKVIRLVRKLNELIIAELNIIPDESSLNYFRYMTHLKYFAQRVIEKVHLSNEDNEILNLVVLRYPSEYNCSKKICTYIEENYHYKPSQDEILYLTVHLSHITNSKEI